MESDFTQTQWDAIIVGTGMGGATLGWALAQAGWRVLFCDKGHVQGDSEALEGRFAEEFFPRPEAPAAKHAALLARAGRCWEEIEDRSTVRVRRYIPFIGAGTGGSSALYGMALERFYPEDFTPRRHYPDADDAALPEAWPISYDDLRPYYRQAEAMFGVHGAPDPLRATVLDPLPAPPAMLGASRELGDFLRAQGLHPYQLPIASQHVNDCLGCQGFLCPKRCKHDAHSVCLTPALRQHGARLLDGCRVVRLEATASEVTGVVCHYQGKTVVLRSRLVVLAAGALETPVLLLRSTSSTWPQGLANTSGLVGRHLMRHFVDLYMVFPKTQDGLGSGLKELAFNDDYLGPEGKAGTVQSFGMLPPASVLVAGLEKDLRDSAMAWMAPLFTLGKPVLRWFLAQKQARSVILASIMEDLPSPDNRVFPAAGGDGLILEYRLRPQDSGRIARWRQRLTALLKPYRPLLLKQAENNERLAHACGTCRFGTDPRASVLDATNRAHDLANLYVVDSSFFPSSGGLNPALTIAANALRVADRLI